MTELIKYQINQNHPSAHLLTRIIHLVNMQDFPKRKHLLPPFLTDQGVRNVKFLENFAYLLNG